MITFPELHKKHPKSETELMLLAAVHHIHSQTQASKDSIWKMLASMSELKIESPDLSSTCAHCGEAFKYNDEAVTIGDKLVHNGTCRLKYATKVYPDKR